MMEESPEDDGVLMSLQQPTSMSRFERLQSSQQVAALAVSQRTMNVTSPAMLISERLAESVQVTSSLLRGIRVTKISSSGKPRSRVLTISRDKLALLCTHARVSKTKGGGGDNDEEEGVSSAVAAKSLLRGSFFSREGFFGFFKGSDDSMRVRYIDVADLDYVHTGLVGTYALERRRTEKRLRGLDSPIDRDRHQIVTIGHHGSETLSVLVADDQVRQELVTCLQQMRANYGSIKSHIANEALLLRYIWYDVDVNHDGRIVSTEFIKIINRLNLYASDAAQRYEEYIAAHHKSDHGKHAIGLSFVECMQLLETIAKPSNEKQTIADDIWNKCFGSRVDTVTASEFLEKFLRRLQREKDVTLENVQVLLSVVNTIELNRPEGSDDGGTSPVDQQIHRSRFEVFLHHSDINDAYDPDAREWQGPLNKPISQYWINSSHNTYLSGNQLESVSSVEMYMKALRRSCKCLELDCWDGEKPHPGGNHVPIVYHGNTLTSKIAFSDIILGVKSYIDTNPTTYPIILSIESHCSPPFEDAMAFSLKSILGTYLYCPTQDVCEADDLPSPESLRGMVVIKGKRPPEPDENDADHDDNIHQVPSSSSHDHDKDPSKPLAALTLFHGTKFRSFDQSLRQPAFHMHSIGESKINKIINKSADNASKWKEYNSHHMTRTYPAGARVDSSNYNPTLAWAMGCQLVALNFQTCDTPLILNDGLFRRNGGCGYVPKPESISGLQHTASAAASSSSSGGGALELTIRILSGSCLPKAMGSKSGEHIDPFVKVTVHDVKLIDHKEQLTTESSHTATVSDNGYSPIWNSESMKFSIGCPDVAIIQFSVWEWDMTAPSEPLADSAIPFSCLRRGYRSVALYETNSNTRTGPFGFATLLVEISY